MPDLLTILGVTSALFGATIMSVSFNCLSGQKIIDDEHDSSQFIEIPSVTQFLMDADTNSQVSYFSWKHQNN